MTAMTDPRTGSRCSLLLASSLAVLSHAPLAADTRTEVRVSAGVGVENNPFLTMDDDGDGAAVAAEISVEPTIYIENERTMFRLFGNARLRQFFNDYGTTDSVLLGADGSTRLDERTNLAAAATFQTSRSAAQDVLLFGRPGLIGLEPGTLPDLPNVDPTIAGAPQRITVFGVNTNVERQLSPRDVGSIGVGFTDSRTEDDLGFDFRVVDLTLGYGRQLSERTTLRGTVALSQSDLVGETAGDAFSITPLVGVQQQISERLNWSAQVGVSYSRIEDGRGGEITNTGLAFLLSGCRRGVNDALCVSGQRQARPTTFGGFGNTTGITVGYDRRLNRRDSFSVNASYNRSDQIAGPLLLDETMSEDDQLIGVAGSFRREFTDRLSGFVNASYSKVTSDLFPDRDANISGYVGVSYLFGRRR